MDEFGRTRETDSAWSQVRDDTLVAGSG